MTTNRDELLACPFCGTVPKGCEHRDVNGEGYYAVECSNCNRSRKIGDPERFCGVHGDDVQSVHAAWNTRALPQRPEGAAVARKTLHDEFMKWNASDGSFESDVAMCKALMDFFAESPPASAVAEPVGYVNPKAVAEAKKLGRMASFNIWNTPSDTCSLAVYVAPQPTQAATVSDADCSRLLESLCAWMLHRFPPGSPEANEADFRMQKARSFLRTLASSPAAPAPVIPESENGR